MPEMCEISNFNKLLKMSNLDEGDAWKDEGVTERFYAHRRSSEADFEVFNVKAADFDTETEKLQNLVSFMFL